MATLTIRRDGTCIAVPFAPPAKLQDVLLRCGCMLPHPCGGRGVCGKCAVTLAGEVSPPDETEHRAGVRLSCRAVLLGDCQVTLPDTVRYHAQSTDAGFLPDRPRPGCVGAAVDIGTTTLALMLYDLGTGQPLGSATMLNPQTAVAADVMGRISAAVTGEGGMLRSLLLDALARLLTAACAGRFPPDAVDTLVITGNTAMLTLLTGGDARPLAAWPFDDAELFGDWREILGRRAYLPRCISAFAGADVTCGLLASGATALDRTALYVDAGTNGEMALWHAGALTVCAAAAGPAFEGAGISCGCGSVPGAVDRAWIEGGRLAVRTIDRAAPAGLCGSGLIDAIACMRRLDWIDASGLAEADPLPVAAGVSLTQADIRALQLAKAAIAAGLRRLAEEARVPWTEVSVALLAGGFGQHIDPASAAAIGLLPATIASRTRAVGNAALAGAAMLLLQPRRIPESEALARSARYVPLGGDESFQRLFLENMALTEMRI